MSKKIVIVGPAYPYRGGQTIVEASVYKRLSAHGWDCHTISFSLLYPKIFFPGTTQFDKSENIVYPHQDKIYRIINSINPITWYKAYKKIKSLKADAVIFVWWMPFFGPAYAFISFLLKKRTDTKIIFLVENFISHEKRKFDLISTKKTLQYADAFITHSKHIALEVKKYFPEKKISATTLSGFDFYNLKRFNKVESRNKLAIGAEKKVILFFGLIRKYKGLEQLIASMPLLLQKDKNYFLLAVGECYEDINTYQEQIKNLGLDNDVLLINKFIANEDVELYFKSADLVCLPYYHATQSGILMMAYGFEKPVVVTKVGGLAELVVNGKTGEIIENNTKENLYIGIEKVMQNLTQVNFAEHIKNLSQTLGQQGLEDIMENFFKENK